MTSAADAAAPISNAMKAGRKASSKTGTGKSDVEIYHERVGCGLFWAVGKFRPTNYMIVSLLHFSLFLPLIHITHAASGMHACFPLHAINHKVLINA